MPKFQKLKGFRDFYPEDFAKRDYITNTWRTVAKRHGFVEYDAPPLESLDLYRHKSGEELVGQLYSFVDKGGRDVAMRPEMTPSVARMVAERWQSLAKPVKWFSIPQLFRYERPQAGRLREHFQFNVDVFGNQSHLLAEVELLSVLIDCFEAFGLTTSDVQIRLSDRRTLNALLHQMGFDEATFPAVYAVLDKFDRQPRDRSRALLVESGIAVASINRLFETVDKLRLARGVPAEYQVDGNFVLFKTFMELREIHPGAEQWIVLDLAIVRGLGYYTGTVFEAFDVKGAYRAICGGGRYDNLLESLGGPAGTAVGFGWGDVVLTDLLTERNLFPPVKSSVDFVVAGDEHYAGGTLGVIGRLRRLGFSATFATKNQLNRVLSVPTGLSDTPRFLLNLGSEIARYMTLTHVATREQFQLEVSDRFFDDLAYEPTNNNVIAFEASVIEKARKAVEVRKISSAE